MKNIITGYLSLVIAIALSACQQEVNYKEVRKEVIDVHDKLMLNEGKVVGLRMNLDTLTSTGLIKLKSDQPNVDTATIHSEASQLINKLDAASDSMSKWMEAFKMDMQGKSNAESVAYFNSEKVKVTRLDSLYKAVITESETFLKQLHMQAGAAGHTHH